MNTKALYQIEYGLFVLTAKLGDKDNGCIVNTVAHSSVSGSRAAAQRTSSRVWTACSAVTTAWSISHRMSTLT